MTSAPDSTTRQLLQGLSKVSLSLKHQAWDQAGRTGLKPTQAAILALLRAREPDQIGPGDVASHLAITPATASEAIATLAARGLITKRRDPTDGRARLLCLTPEGAEAAQHAADWPDALLEAVGELDEAERAVLLRSILRMIHALQRRGAVPLQRMCANCTHFRPQQHAGSGTPHHCAFIDAPIGDADLRTDCGDMQLATDADRPRLWRLFVEGAPVG